MNCTWRVVCTPDGHWKQLFLCVVARDRDNQIVPPRTKKNSPRIIPGLKHPILLPSAAYKRWESAATKSMALVLIQLRQNELMGLTDYVNVEAQVYRDRNIGDANGFTQAIGDWLEHAGILANDKQIESWDGTERLKDAECPRVELCLTYLWPAKAKPSARPKVSSALPIYTGLPLFDESVRKEETPMQTMASIPNATTPKPKGGKKSMPPKGGKKGGKGC
jgi:hypothetical protein